MGSAEEAKGWDKGGGAVTGCGGVLNGDGNPGVEGTDSFRLRTLDSCPNAASKRIIPGTALFGRNSKSGVILAPSFTLSSSPA